MALLHMYVGISNLSLPIHTLTPDHDMQGPTARAQITTPGANRYFPETQEQNPKDNKADEG
ncbi:hypothetical protein H0H93_013589, partial [Arthromyces matolae]